MPLILVKEQLSAHTASHSPSPKGWLYHLQGKTQGRWQGCSSRERGRLAAGGQLLCHGDIDAPYSWDGCCVRGVLVLEVC